jgi:hypothetical protein
MPALPWGLARFYPMNGPTQSLSRGTYDADENLRLALTHLVQIIGEAGRQVSREFADRHLKRSRICCRRSSRICGRRARRPRGGTVLNTLEGRNGSGEFARRSMKNLDSSWTPRRIPPTFIP